jgi:outer membrane immunogenic protein
MLYHQFRGLFAAGSVAAAFCGVPAIAAPPAPMFNWSGFYMGLNAGGSWGTSNATTDISVPSLAFFGLCPACLADFAAKRNQSFNTSGFTGGIQGGYNWQTGNLLAGFELDFEYFRSAGSKIYFAGLQTPGSITTNIKTDWLFTARPRLGVVANNWLFYGTGGLAVTGIRAKWSYFDTTNAPCDCENASVSKTKAGWAVGGGIEAPVSGGWTVGGEYLYVNFGRVSTTGTLLVGVIPADTFSHSIDLKSNIVRVRLNNKF